ncbi:MAG: M48 family metallopeptidase [Gammaproteobacteria bacterium]|jgi:Zn-dependent protease with chaperone function|nr:M48 family metallopeptidase [Gammaproteobacteria bacterium]MDP7455494.1 M48 family metallopeptidase [Gammaproteobacteria bacterium]|tara:strand:- start:4199 stop:6121 length:1923 start_codon:yes stop_codon:yes gene_type:complete
MDFFASQDTAKRNTGKLVFLFVMAVIALVVVTNFLVMFIFGFLGSEMTSMAAISTVSFDWNTFLLVGLAVVSVILLGSLYKIGSLSGGGARVAEMMNGRLLVAGSGDLHERRILNIVEEMAIASGTPVPPVYLMEESGINAFAAGYSPSDAVIGVTRGAIETLSRDQLQGVIAHEFSHILHGDMRINIRLIGVLHGIMVLGIIGYHLLRGGAYSRRSKNSGGIVFFGLALVVVGFVGTFFGNLIKAAVSRQREYLADASAVQFTRNPDGIGGALMRIATHDSRSYIANPSSAEISHTLFEEGSVSALSRLYATHPPLENRIKAILPRWDGDYGVAATGPDADLTAEAEKAAGPTTREKAEALLGGVAGVLITDAMIKQVGNPSAAHLRAADALLQQIPAPLLEAAHDPSAARALIYFLVLEEDAALRERQLKFLQQSADAGVYFELAKIVEQLDKFKAEYRLPLITIALGSLRQLSKPQFILFKENFDKLIAVDKKISLFEWATHKIVFRHLEAVFANRKSKLGRKELVQCKKSCEVLLSILAYSNKQQGISQQDAFDKASSKLPQLDMQIIDESDICLGLLNAALDDLVELKPLQKPALLKACAACITADKEVSPIETELFRAIADTLDCPMPPLVSSD